MKDTVDSQMEQYIAREDWKSAIATNKKLIVQNPESHWHLTKQSEFYYENGQYRRALKYSQKALELAPHCPLVLWNYAEALYMLDQEAPARHVYLRLVRRGAKRIACDECSNGPKWGESLVADCLYSIGVGYAREERTGLLAVRYLRRHLAMRKSGLRSRYSLSRVRRRLEGLEAEAQLKRYGAKRDWRKAIAANKNIIARYPDSHFHLTKQSEFFYQLRQYDTALKYSQRALKYSPQCPLALWNYAEALAMLDQTEKARRIYKRLVRRGVKGIAFGKCNEGLKWAENLFSDCLYAIGSSYAYQGKRKLAIRYFKRHLASRKPGRWAAFSLKHARRRLADLEKGTS
jgi:predicted Zn-dependent protease